MSCSTAREAAALSLHWPLVKKSVAPSPFIARPGAFGGPPREVTDRITGNARVGGGSAGKLHMEFVPCHARHTRVGTPRGWHPVLRHKLPALSNAVPQAAKPSRRLPGPFPACRSDKPCRTLDGNRRQTPIILSWLDAGRWLRLESVPRCDGRRARAKIAPLAWRWLANGTPFGGLICDHGGFEDTRTNRWSNFIRLPVRRNRRARKEFHIGASIRRDFLITHFVLGRGTLFQRPGAI